MGLGKMNEKVKSMKMQVVQLKWKSFVECLVEGLSEKAVMMRCGEQ